MIVFFFLFLLLQIVVKIIELVEKGTPVSCYESNKIIGSEFLARNNKRKDFLGPLEALKRAANSEGSSHFFVPEKQHPNRAFSFGHDQFLQCRSLLLR